MKRLILICLCLCSPACFAVTYVSQSGGTFSGGAACNAQTAISVATFNAGTEAAGGVYYLCGTITTGLTLNSSGAAGNVITLRWDTGARISQSVAQAININNQSYWLFDGLVACGPGTACNTVEAANPTGYATGQAGIIEATANGSALANQNATSQAFTGCTSSSCHDIEIRNLIIRNLYQHTLTSDATANIDGGAYTFQCSGCGGVVSIHDSDLHDGGNQINIASTAGGMTLNVYNNDFWHDNWGIAPTGTGTRTVNIYNNHFHDASNWDTVSDAFHHNAIHEFLATSHGTDSTALNVYNNISDGNWGSCCTTAIGIFVDTGGFSTPSNQYYFNNVCVQHAGDTSPCAVISGITTLVANNTMLGDCANNDNTYGLSVGATSTGVTVKNNIIQCYSQYVQLNSGATITSWDYNTYGNNPFPSGAGAWDCNGTGYSTFATWKSGCTYDTNGQQNNTLSLTSAGVPLIGSVVISAGTNLTSLGITALNSDIAGTARPSSTAWNTGAYQTALVTDGFRFIGVLRGVVR